MTVPSIVAASTAGGWQSATPVPVPEGTQDRDLLLVWLSGNGSGVITDEPEGWGLVASQVGAPLGQGTGVHLYSRRASAEDGPYTWEWEGEHWHYAIMVAVRGAAGVRTSDLAVADGVSSIDLPGLDAVPGDLLLGFGFHWGTDAGSEPDFASMATVASQATILVAAQDPIVASGISPAHPLTSATVGRMAAAAVVLEPTPPPVVPVWEQLPERRPLPPAPLWRFYAMRWTGTWVHRELPLRDVSITHTLSGPGDLSASIEPTYGDLIAEDGMLVLREWDTIILAEAAGQLRGAGILVSTEITGDELSLECVGFSGYAGGMPLTETLRWGGPTNGLSGQGVDPATVIRWLWNHLQDQPDGGLGVQVDNLSTPYRLGVWHNARKLPTEDEPNPPAAEIEEPPIPIDRVWTSSDSRPTAATGKSVYWEYRLDWFEDIEVGAKVDEICQQAKIEYREHVSWGPDRESVNLRLQLGYPRLGRRQSGLRFVEGENISELVTLSRSGDDYANVVAAYGSGEGSKQKRATASQRDGRLRRVQIVDAEDVENDAALGVIARDHLARTRQITDISSFTVRDHPNAELGSFDAGDDVLVETVIGWQPTRMWVRILSYTYSPDGDTVAVSCTRSDSFDYSGR